MTSSYAWLIIHDSLADKGAPLGSYQNAVGLAGPRDASDEMIHLLHRAATVGKDKWQGTPVQWFKMYDDDRNLYYRGVRTASDAEEGFEPLDDFGTPNAGAVQIDYYNPVTKEWYTL